MLKTDSLKFIQDNYKKLSVEEIAKSIGSSPKYLKTTYPQYFSGINAIVYSIKHNVYIIDERGTIRKSSLRPSYIPYNYKVTTTDEFIRWQNPLLYRYDRRAIEKKYKDFFKEKVELKPKRQKRLSDYIYNDGKIQRIFKQTTLTKIAFALDITRPRVVYLYNIGIIQKF